MIANLVSLSIKSSDIGDGVFDFMPRWNDNAIKKFFHGMRYWKFVTLAIDSILNSGPVARE